MTALELAPTGHLPDARKDITGVKEGLRPRAEGNIGLEPCVIRAMCMKVKPRETSAIHDA